MLQTHQNILVHSTLLLATVLVYVGARATVGVFGNGSNPVVPEPSTCPSRSVNYITQTLPQQCFTTVWAGKNEEYAASSIAVSLASNDGTSQSSAKGSHVTISPPSLSPLGTSSKLALNEPSQSDLPPATSQLKAPATDPKVSGPSEAGAETENDSPFDNAHFLSFEEWKKQNLAKVGQSPESLGLGRSGAGEPRRRPGGISNALDSLGEDTEIEIDFGGFVNPQVPSQVPRDSAPGAGDEGTTQSDKSSHGSKTEHLPSARARSKDAGVTCKERSNYASFDCAATVLKTNPESKGSNSILVENKDNYMLNECSANNKFLIVELCDNILIDTIVLANFEFFSSIFRTFRVSVSDRYPVKLEKWRELGTFNARNSRDVQAFLVEEPQIWARYLRIEFLTYFGNEYYCPVSLLRVHGTTMMEEFNRDLKASRGEEDSEGDIEQDGQDLEGSENTPDKVKADSSVKEPEFDKTQPVIIGTTAPPPPSPVETSSQHRLNDTTPSENPQDLPQPLIVTTPFASSLSAQMEAFFKALERSDICNPQDEPEANALSSPIRLPSQPTTTSSTTSLSIRATTNITSSSSLQKPSSISSVIVTSSVSTSSDIIDSKINENKINSSRSVSHASQSYSKPHSSSTQPPASNPTTQESFFKSFHKRLQLLEANSTLSLQYIEEQSRILRDAFSKVEKRQLAKTTTFLETLNTTVMNEVREFRTQYDQIWQSTVLELSAQRQQSQHEIAALSARLTLLADELLFQKRIAILQFLLIILCLGLTIFSRGSAAAGVNYLEHVVNKSSINLSRYASHFDSPPGSPSSTRPSLRYGIFSRATSFHRRSPSEDSMGIRREQTKSPSIEYEPPTPTSQQSEEAARESDEGRDSPLSTKSGCSEAPVSVNGVTPRASGGLLSPDAVAESSSSGGTTPSADTDVGVHT